jgi:membrane protease YdiL (CAAX protease family)
MPPWLLPLAGVAFALVNSAVEEAIFRGIFLQALESAVGAGIISLVMQAGIFGWLHYSEVGFPKGLAGVAMASVYGLWLGYLRYRSRGMLAPWLAHAGTDIAVFAIVVTSAKQ